MTVTPQIPYDAMTRLLRNRVACGACGDIIESLHRHDSRTCGCGATMVDGGHAYPKTRFGEAGFTDLREYESDERF